MGWLAPAIVAILSGSVILAAVFLYLYATERQSWMGIWGAAWVAYCIRFGIELAQAVGAAPGVGWTVVANLIVLLTGVLLLEGTYRLTGGRSPRWLLYLAVMAAVWTILAPALGLPLAYSVSPAWIFRGIANIAAGVVWYRRLSDPGPWGKVTGVSFVIWGLHNLDYPFLRGVASFASFGFMLGALLEFVIAFGALIAHFDRTRAQLSESESRYRAFFEGSASVMLILDPTDASIVQANAAASGYYGWSNSELTNMRMDQINPMSAEEILHEMSLATGGKRLMFNFQHRLKSGEVRHVEVHTGPVIFDGRELLYSIVHDVTDRTDAERELRESEERYSTLFEDSLTPMLTVAVEDSAIIDANTAAARMYGLSVGALIGMRMYELSTESVEQVRQEVERTIADGGRVGIFQHKRSDGTVFDVEIYSTPIVSGSRTVLYTICNDISARVEAQRELALYQHHLEELVEERTAALSKANIDLERAAHAKDEYLANMSHELRTPLNSVIGFSDLLMRGLAGDLNEEQNRQIGMINESGQHLLTVVDGILDLARISAGAVEVNMADTDISELCIDVAERIAPLVAKRGIGMDVDVEPGVVVRTDRHLLEQVLWNLLGNAVKFTDAGRIGVSLELIDGFARIIVRDTGRGVAPEDQWRVFEMFVRIADENGARSDGTGLGLPISKRLVDVLGGEIEFASEAGMGSVFMVKLPL